MVVFFVKKMHVYCELMGNKNIYLMVGEKATTTTVAFWRLPCGVALNEGKSHGNHGFHQRF